MSILPCLAYEFRATALQPGLPFIGHQFLKIHGIALGSGKDYSELPGRMTYTRRLNGVFARSGLLMCFWNNI